MSKLRWEKARRNPSGYASINGGPEEIVGNERAAWATKRALPLTANRSKESGVTGFATKVAGKGKGKGATAQATKAVNARTGPPIARVEAAPASKRKQLRREVLAYLIRMGPGRTEADLAMALYGAAAQPQNISKDFDILVREGWVERKHNGSNKDSCRYFPKR